jgi:hypothetical protein
MRKNILSPKYLFITAALLTSAHAAPLFTATSVTVTPAIPEPGDSSVIAWEKGKAGKDSATAAAEAAQDPVYLVKVYIKLPPMGSESYQLWVGDDEIREYGGFKKGLFFKVYDEELLGKWAGKPLRMGKRGQAPQSLGQDFPQADAKGRIRAAGSSAAAPRSKIKDVLAD